MNILISGATTISKTVNTNSWTTLKISIFSRHSFCTIYLECKVTCLYNNIVWYIMLHVRQTKWKRHLSAGVWRELLFKNEVLGSRMLFLPRRMRLKKKINGKSNFEILAFIESEHRFIYVFVKKIENAHLNRKF